MEVWQITSSPKSAASTAPTTHTAEATNSDPNTHSSAKTPTNAYYLPQTSGVQLTLAEHLRALDVFLADIVHRSAAVAGVADYLRTLDGFSRTLVQECENVAMQMANVERDEAVRFLCV